MLNRDRYEGMSTRQLKEKLDEYQQSELDFLACDEKKEKQLLQLERNCF